MTSTTLKFLAADGTVTAQFTPALTAAQYERLLAIATGEFRTTKELCERIRRSADEWGVTCVLDDC